MIDMRLMNICAKSSRTRFDCTFSNETARVNCFIEAEIISMDDPERIG